MTTKSKVVAPPVSVEPKREVDLSNLDLSGRYWRVHGLAIHQPDCNCGKCVLPKVARNPEDGSGLKEPSTESAPEREEVSEEKEALEPNTHVRQMALSVHGDEPTFDAGGYPTDETEQTIIEWPHGNGFHSLLAYVARAWRYPERFTVDTDAYRVSTGGWSGNEQLIDALQRNRVFWAFCWESSTRGGHYVFTEPTPSVPSATANHAQPLMPPKSNVGSGKPKEDQDSIWELFPSYLIDHYEGSTVSEEFLQRALATMLADKEWLAKYAETKRLEESK